MIRPIGFALVAIGLAGCTPSTPVSPASSVAPAPPRHPAPPGDAPGEESTRPPLVVYEPKGRRDPFEPLEVLTGAKGFTVSSTRLTGIVQGSGETLALVEGSDGIGYILRAGDTLGDGRLLEIGTDSAVFSVVPRPGASATRVTLRLKTDL